MTTQSPTSKNKSSKPQSSSNKKTLEETTNITVDTQEDVDLYSTSEKPLEFSGLYWSKVDAVKAAQKHTFIRVNKSNSRSSRQINGAERVWNRPETQDEVYLPTYRITGNPQNIAIALNRAGYTEEQVLEALEDAISRNNYKSDKAELYQEEMFCLRAFKKEQKKLKEQEKISWDSLLVIASNAKKSHVVLQDKGDSQRGASKRKTFLQQYKRIQGQEDKVVDVSNMRDDGTGILVKNKPTSSRSRYVVIDAVPVVSNNEERFLRALEFLFNTDKFESEDAYQKVINIVRAEFNKKRRQ
jgi:hypothetical protein